MSKTVVSALSGGRDSTAMTIRMLELGEQLDYIIFSDTGYEFPEMYEYLENLDIWLKEKYNIGITRIDPKTSLDEWMFTEYKKGNHVGKKRGLPPALYMSYCTRELKKMPILKWSKSLGVKSEDLIMLIGYVAREDRQTKLDFGKPRYPLKEWGWNEPEVDEYLKSLGIYNQLYRHFSRTGCYLCPKQNLASWKALYLHYPKLWEKAKWYEHQAKDANAHIQTWRVGTSLDQLEVRFDKEVKQGDFNQEWNEEDSDLSCFCK